MGRISISEYYSICPNGERYRMHGEYKVPGGKLIVVDLDIIEGKLHNIELSGDFFLEPDSALLDMTNVLEGLAIDTTAEILAYHVHTAVIGAELLGITPEGVALAVRRAIEGDIL